MYTDSSLESENFLKSFCVVKLNNSLPYFFSEVSSGTTLPNYSEQFKCYDDLRSIPIDRVCDGSMDCPDLSDECLCVDAPKICKKVVQYNSHATAR